MGRNGQRRVITADELKVVEALVALVMAGVSPPAAEPVARDLAAGRVGVLGGFAVVGASQW
jgi:hypothetical protein